MSDRELYEIDPKKSRQSQIEASEVGDSVAIVQRMDLAMGLPEEAIRRQTEMLRNILDQQTARARRKFKERQFIVENGTFLTRSNAVIVSVVCTRTS